jgi:hypothetical protein
MAAILILLYSINRLIGSYIYTQFHSYYLPMTGVKNVPAFTAQSICINDI